MVAMSKNMGQEDSRAGTTSDTNVAQARAAFSMHGFRVTLVRMVIIGGFLLLWQIASGRWIEPFLMNDPPKG